MIVLKLTKLALILSFSMEKYEGKTFLLLFWHVNAIILDFSDGNKHKFQKAFSHSSLFWIQWNFVFIQTMI